MDSHNYSWLPSQSQLAPFHHSSPKGYHYSYSNLSGSEVEGMDTDNSGMSNNSENSIHHTNVHQNIHQNNNYSNNNNSYNNNNNNYYNNNNNNNNNNTRSINQRCKEKGKIRDRKRSAGTTIADDSQ